MAVTDAEMKELVVRVNGHDNHIADLNLVVFGNDAMKIPSLPERLAAIEKMLNELATWQRDVKLLLRVGVGLLATITGGTGVIAWPRLIEILGKIGGG